jgi:uncharacterized membrane protein YdjX (TVP38/TMEM64 family)
MGIMKKPVEQTPRHSKGPLLKAIILLAFLIGAFCTFRFTPVKDILNPDTLAAFLESLGAWAPIAFIVFEGVLICLFVPASIPVVLGAAVFGSNRGFVYGWVGAMAGACGAFFIGRALGRDFVASLIGDRLKRYDDAIERNGFATVLYLRLLNSPFTPLNFGFALTKIHFRDYLFGTGLGVILSIFIITFLGGTLKEVWVSGNWKGLMSLKVLIATLFFIFSFFIPKIIKKIRLIP